MSLLDYLENSVGPEHGDAKDATFAQLQQAEIAPGEQQPIFTLDQVQLQFPGRLLAMAVSNNILLLALDALKLLRIRLDETHIIEDVEIQRKLKESVHQTDNVHALYLDPTGRHCIITTQHGENYYLWEKWKRAKLLTKWKNIVITAVAWNKSATSNSALSTLPILLGSSHGNVYETELCPTDPDNTNATVAPSMFWRSAISAASDDVKYFRLVFTLPKVIEQPPMAVTGIHFESFPAEPQKYVIFISSMQRLHEIIGKSSAYADTGPTVGSGTASDISVFESIFAQHTAGAENAALIKLPPMFTSTALSCFCPVFANGHLGSAQKISWLTGQGIYQGQLSYGSQSAGGSIVDSLRLFEYPSAYSMTPPAKPVANNAFGRDNDRETMLNEHPFALYLTDFHYLLIYPDRIKAAWALDSPDFNSSNDTDNDALQQQSKGDSTKEINTDGQKAKLQAVWERTLPIGNNVIKGFVVDSLGKTYWLYTSSAVYELSITSEDRDVWKFYLERNLFDNALTFAKTPSQKSLIRKFQAGYYYRSGRYILSAQCYAQCLAQVSFEDVTLKFIEKNEQEALRTYLTLVLERLVKRKEFVQTTMIATWLLEINLDKLNRIEELVRQEEKSQSAKQELTILNEDVRHFLKMYQTHLDPRTTYTLMTSLGRVEEMLYFAQLIGDYERILEHYILEQQWNKALELLTRLMSPELHYHFAPTLIEHVPAELVLIWMRIPELDVKELFPALLRYSTSNNPPGVKKHQVMRYLDHIISKQGTQDAALHNYYLSLLVQQDADSEADLLSYLTNNSTGRHYSLEFALRQCLEYKKTRACVYLLGEMQRFEEAVDISLKANALELSQEYADKPIDNETLRKKLWLKIAQYVVEQKQDIKQAMLFLNESNLLKIEDILPLFPDFVLIDEFKDEIIAALEEYNQHQQELSTKMKETSQSARRLREQLDDMKHQYVVVSKLDQCEECREPISNQTTGIIRTFYVFPCGHVFHGQCLYDKAQQMLPVRIARRLRDIYAALTRETPVSRMDMLRNTFTNMSGVSGPNTPTLGGPVREVNGPTSKGNSTSGSKIVSPVSAANAVVIGPTIRDLDDLLCADCLLCGDAMIRSIEMPFINENDATLHESWAL